MIIPDANLLLFAYNEAAAEHRRARAWWEDAMNGSDTVGLPWQVVTAFLRITTNPRAFSRPLDSREATAIVTTWLDQPVAQVVVQGANHWRIFSQLLVDGRTTGPMVMDAHLAAIAIEHGAILLSNDRDFTRFRGLRLENPLS